MFHELKMKKGRASGMPMGEFREAITEQKVVKWYRLFLAIVTLQHPLGSEPLLVAPYLCHLSSR